MSRSLSSMVLKGFTSKYFFESKVSAGSVFKQAMMYSIKISGDSETHEDFRPTNRLESSGISVHDVVKQDVTGNPIMIYMKGVPDAPRCGFSALAVTVLQQYGVPLSARNILEDPELKEGIKAFSKWPTFPQIFVKGEFVGGSDIILDMHKNGKLKELLTDVKSENDSV